MKILFALLVLANVALYILSVGKTDATPQASIVSRAVNAKSMLLLSEVQPQSPVNEPLTTTDSEICLRIGPFGSEQTAQQAISKLKQHQLTYRQRTVSARPLIMYRVYIGPLADSQNIDEVLDRLESEKVDHYQMRGSSNPLISLGLFSGQPAAENYTAKLNGLGFDVKMRTENRSLGPFHWLISDPVKASIVQQMDGVTWADPLAGIRSLPCETVAQLP